MSEELSTSSTRLDNKILDALKSLKKKWKMSNVSEVIDRLMKDHKDFDARIKVLEARLQAPSQPSPSEPTTPVEAQKDTQKEAEKSAEVPAPQIESQPCAYYSYNHPQALVHCSKDYDTKGMIHRVTQEVCDLCWDRVQSKKSKIEDDVSIAKQYPCLCRFDHDNEWLCAHNAPTIRRLEFGLKICQSCPDRLTEERTDALRTHRYITCGATVNEDKKAGLLVFGSKNPDCPHEGQAMPIKACFAAKCTHAKLVQYVQK